MRIIKYLIIGLSIALCHACASTPEPTKYYSLTPDASNNDLQSPSHVIQVVISRVHLTKLLQQDGILTRTGKNEISVAHYHRWAEPLDEAIVKLLVNSLNARSSLYHFSMMMDDVNQKPAYTLRLTIEKFDITDDGAVTLGGRFWVLDKDLTSMYEQAFEIDQRLEEDGYPHAVEKLKKTIVLLADSIIKRFNDLDG